MSRRLRQLWISGGVIVWIALLVLGYKQILAYSFKPGASSAAPSRLPSEFAGWRSADRPLLILALHPQCPCSRASVAELADLLSWTPEACDLVLLVFQPAGAIEWNDRPGVYRELERFRPRVVTDVEGELAAQFGAYTSGHVIFYDDEGQLAFAGGITSGRGHRGRTGSQTALKQLLRGRSHELGAAPTFGCRIQDSHNFYSAR